MIVGLPVLAVLLSIAAFLEMQRFRWQRVFEVWFELAAVIVLCVVVNSIRTLRARWQLQDAKKEIDFIGYVVACDQTDEFQPQLSLDEQEPEGQHVRIPAFKPIDFKQYDDVFRVLT